MHFKYKKKHFILISFVFVYFITGSFHYRIFFISNFFYRLFPTFELVKFLQIYFT